MAVFLRGPLIASHSQHSYAAAQSAGALSAGLNVTYVRVEESRFESNHAKGPSSWGPDSQCPACQQGIRLIQERSATALAAQQLEQARPITEPNPQAPCLIHHARSPTHSQNTATLSSAHQHQVTSPPALHRRSRLQRPPLRMRHHGKLTNKHQPSSNRPTHVAATHQCLLCHDNIGTPTPHASTTPTRI